MSFSMSRYLPADWYWFVGGDETRAWSSARTDYVPSDDAIYVAWAAEPGHDATRIDTEANLRDVLLAAYPPGAPPAPPTLDLSLVDNTFAGGEWAFPAT